MGWIPGRTIVIALLVLLGLALRLPHIEQPLFEGAAGKQAHTAMVARNFVRGEGSFLRPVVDDVGHPGYFVKEAPIVPALAALVYAATGRVDERVGRLIGVVCWLAGLPIFMSLLGWRRPLVAELAGFWYVVAPLGVAYSRAFMNDAPAVVGSLGTVALCARWAAHPTRRDAILVGLCLWVSVLLKPHVVFWVGPAMAVFLGAGRGTTVGRDPRWILVLSILVGTLLSSMWYAHAAVLHAQYPVHGATVAEGWFDPSLLHNADFYRELYRQDLQMVFTPVGAALAVFAIPSFLTGLRVVDRAMLAWGAGVLIQCLVFDTRMLDGYSRGTEYYQLAMVPVAALLIGTGLAALVELVGRLSRRIAVGTLVAGIAALFLYGRGAAREAMIPPDRYKSVLADCALVQRVTSSLDEIVVLADRAGVVHYYCDRRGTAFVLEPEVALAAARRTDPAMQARAFASARFVYVPFPELLDPQSSMARRLEAEWVESGKTEGTGRLYERSSKLDRRQRG